LDFWPFNFLTPGFKKKGQVWGLYWEGGGYLIRRKGPFQKEVGLFGLHIKLSSVLKRGKKDYWGRKL